MNETDEDRDGSVNKSRPSLLALESLVLLISATAAKLRAAAEMEATEGYEEATDFDFGPPEYPRLEWKSMNKTQAKHGDGAGRLARAHSLQILHLEDSPTDAVLILRILEDGGLACAVTHALNGAEFETALERERFDIILCDHKITGYSGFEALEFARKHQPQVPVIMLSGVLDDEQAVQSLKNGATDYILKERLARLVPAIRRAMEEADERVIKKELEAVVLRAQRMESIGALAGGIVHDFKNTLSPALLSAELLEARPDAGGWQKHVEVILSSVRRATSMAQRILSFTHGRGGGSGQMAVNGPVRETEKMVRDTFPKSIEISVKAAGKKFWKIQGDPTDLQQALLNLCMNARDAMPDGGRLTLSVQNVNLDGEQGARLDGAAGPYVMVSVMDTGGGIAPEALPHIFEPFFTTKSADKGTGLGLSIVARIMKHHGGCIDVQTELGKGTEFRLYFPALETVEAAEAPRESASPPTGHGELILLIEDEEAVRELTKTSLENFGYRVVAASNGVQGLARFAENRDRVRVVVTDTEMPEMRGLEAVRAMKEQRPELPVIIASGSEHSAEESRWIETERMTHLGKPYGLRQLLVGVATAIRAQPVPVE
jgi:signal transduction histidine kinase